MARLARRAGSLCCGAARRVSPKTQNPISAKLSGATDKFSFLLLFGVVDTRYNFLGLAQEAWPVERTTGSPAIAERWPRA